MRCLKLCPKMCIRVKIMKFILLILCGGLSTPTLSWDNLFCSYSGLMLEAFLCVKGSLQKIQSKDVEKVFSNADIHCKKFKWYLIKDMFVKTMRKRNVLLEQTCDKNELLRKAQINRDNLYHVNIKVILVHLFYLKWIEVHIESVHHLVSCLQGSLVLLDSKHVQAFEFEWNTDTTLE